MKIMTVSIIAQIQEVMSVNVSGSLKIDVQNSKFFIATLKWFPRSSSLLHAQRTEMVFLWRSSGLDSSHFCALCVKTVLYAHWRKNKRSLTFTSTLMEQKKPTLNYFPY